MGKQRGLLELHDVGDDAVAFLPGVHDVKHVAALGADQTMSPAEPFRFMTPT